MKYMSFRDLIQQSVERDAKKLAWESLTHEQREDFIRLAKITRDQRMQKEMYNTSVDAEEK